MDYIKIVSVSANESEIDMVKTLKHDYIDNMLNQGIRYNVIALMSRVANVVIDFFNSDKTCNFEIIKDFQATSEDADKIRFYLNKFMISMKNEDIAENIIQSFKDVSVEALKVITERSKALS